jgi:hypothetical protein
MVALKLWAMTVAVVAVVVGLVLLAMRGLNRIADRGEQP